MKFSKSCFLLVVCYLSFSSCENEGETIVAANNRFTTELYDVLPKDGNVFFSPVSVDTILALTAQGANVETETALRDALHISDKASSAIGFHSAISNLNNVQNVTLETANKVYIKDGLTMNPDFKKVAVDDFYAETENLDFGQNIAAASTINTWVSKKTHDKIQNLISPDSLSADTSMVLVNAIYFKANWANKFKKSETTKQNFYTSKDNPVQVDMMYKTAHYNYKADDELKAKVIQLPYANPSVSMVVVLPYENDGINDLEVKMKNYDLTSLTKGMRDVEVELRLPKFKLETTMDLKEPLTKLGLGIIFSNNANFSGLIEGNLPLKVSKVIQKAFIEVDEEGSEAAAATGVLVATFAAISPREKVIFDANHPFIFMINARHYDGEVVLFLGKLIKN